jgi:hypothetical protein
MSDEVVDKKKRGRPRKLEQPEPKEKQKRGRKPNPNKPPINDTGNKYNKVYYDNKKDDIAKKRILKRLEEGDSSVSNKSLIKYGLI